MELFEQFCPSSESATSSTKASPPSIGDPKGNITHIRQPALIAFPDEKVALHDALFYDICTKNYGGIFSTKEPLRSRRSPRGDPAP